ncbi:hypothetical protein CCACVL1_13745 [Corchorus capsularis]|uniref:Uncharacterized protein n=1 Tax=Corchorus capsularis TaxID=210143 RepID=A0A1R3I9V2_COCAP|nr:hypothetical protein CCACVL1_13745 [Corchorus capsularis]
MASKAHSPGPDNDDSSSSANGILSSEQTS